MQDVILKVIKGNLGKDQCNDSDIKIERFDSGGANYTSMLYKIVVTTAGDEIKLFAKVAALSEAMREGLNADWIFHTEQYVYRNLAKIYDDIQDLHAVPVQHRFIFPKFFGCQREKGVETIITEDLGARGYRSHDRFRPMDWKYASVAVRTLAKFHALSFAYQKEYPEEFKRVSKEMVTKLEWDSQFVEQFRPPTLEAALKAIDEGKRDRVRKILFKKTPMRNYTNPVEKVVLVHGDYRLSNLLFKKQDGRLDVIPVDYQIVHSGCVVSDLIYFIGLGSDRQFRAKYFRKLIEYYYEQLGFSLERLSLDIDKVYPRKIFDIEFEKTLSQMLVHAVLLLPIVMIDVDAAPKPSEVATNFDIELTEEYKERLRGIVDDCIEWGAI